LFYYWLLVVSAKALLQVMLWERALRVNRKLRLLNQ
jgi:hypothetical protein